MSVINLNEWRKKLAERSTSKFPSKPNGKSGKRGQTLPDSQLAHIEAWTEEMSDLISIYFVLDSSKKSPFTVKSKFARDCAEWIGFCASEGFITTKVDHQAWDNKWRITVSGNQLHRDLEDELSQLTKQ